MPTVILTRKASAAGDPLGSHPTATEYLHQIGVPDLRPCTAPFDNGYDSATVESHLDQGASLMEILKISMPCWMIADESAARRKVAAAATHSVPIMTGNGLFQIAVARGLVESYLDLCAEFGLARVECSEGQAEFPVRPSLIVKMAHARGLEVQYELGDFDRASVVLQRLIDHGNRWLDAGAVQLTAHAGGMESGSGLAIPTHFNPSYAESLALAFGIERMSFSAPAPSEQFAILSHFGREVHLCDVRLEDLLNVESFRRGLHSAGFSSPQLHPGPPFAR